ncbi:hypothetical protein C8F04DRAFT_112950 [Mycena alexandri]|uniref:Uncharacterized protein n=1 Tax=Mycena alexandri TaxID=1745969 RepID=A0AAD6TBF2_9AGAR|nr:hypothetical protein C8F04DRAFT_112950 [Mycena alexandri]
MSNVRIFSDDIRTAVDESHGDVEFGHVELSAVIDVGQSPDPREIVLVEPTLAKDTERSGTVDEARLLGVPGAEDGVVALLLRRSERPGDARLLRLTLLEGLLEREAVGQLLLLELRGTACAVGRGGVEGHERAGHHLQAWIDEAGGLGDEGSLGGEASWLGAEGWAGGGVHEAIWVLLGGEEAAGLALELGREGWDGRGRRRGSLLEICADVARRLRLQKALLRRPAKARLLRLLEALRTGRNIARLLGHQPASKTLLLLLRILLQKLWVLWLELRVLLLLLLLELRILLELWVTARKSRLHGVLVPWLLPLGHGGGRRG